MLPPGELTISVEAPISSAVCIREVCATKTAKDSMAAPSASNMQLPAVVKSRGPIADRMVFEPSSASTISMTVSQGNKKSEEHTAPMRVIVSNFQASISRVCPSP